MVRQVIGKGSFDAARFEDGGIGGEQPLGSGRVQPLDRILVLRQNRADGRVLAVPRRLRLCGRMIGALR